MPGTRNPKVTLPSHVFQIVRRMIATLYGALLQVARGDTNHSLCTCVENMFIQEK